MSDWKLYKTLGIKEGQVTLKSKNPLSKVLSSSVTIPFIRDSAENSGIKITRIYFWIRTL